MPPEKQLSITVSSFPKMIGLEQVYWQLNKIIELQCQVLTIVCCRANLVNDYVNHHNFYISFTGQKYMEQTHQCDRHRFFLFPSPFKDNVGTGILLHPSGPSCSKLTTSLVKIYICKYAEIFC